MRFSDPEDGLDRVFMADTAGQPERASQSTGPVDTANAADWLSPKRRGAFSGSARVSPPTSLAWRKFCRECASVELTSTIDPQTGMCTFGHVEEPT